MVVKKINTVAVGFSQYNELNNISLIQKFKSAMFNEI